ncbi:MAG: type IV toxin-antitoxin system AbiEi family antitoxin domain-containing protein [Acidimicrobiia bacterium]|nr:MAG: type IV toxin-antitoxin system AbiEi family antitoxin domain-containing protein [Acidimicrobiia bacterium]
MTTMDRILEIAGDQHGYITARQANEAGIPPVELRKLAQRGRLDHPAHGVYRVASFPRRAVDELMQATLWADGRGVISHESALALWDLADVNPQRIHVTVPPPYRPRKRGGDKYRIWTRPLDPRDIDYVEGVPTVTPERAIIDATLNGLQRRFIQQAILTARNRQLFGRETEMRIRQRLQDTHNDRDDAS